MEMPVIQRIKGRAQHVEPVAAYFTNGHVLWVFPSTGGYGGDAGRYVERVVLYRGSTEVAVFHSPYQHPINYTPFGFVKLTDGYTPARVFAYWEVAYDHLNEEQFKRAGRRQTAWEIFTASSQVMHEVRDGKWHTPTQPTRRR